MCFSINLIELFEKKYPQKVVAYLYRIFRILIGVITLKLSDTSIYIMKEINKSRDQKLNVQDILLRSGSMRSLGKIKDNEYVGFWVLKIRKYIIKEKPIIIQNSPNPVDVYTITNKGIKYLTKNITI